MKINGIFIRLAAVAQLFLLSGCLSYTLVNNTRTDPSTTHWNTDTITGYAQVQKQSGEQGWAFTGEQFDYFLTSTSDDIIRLLQDKHIERRNLQVRSDKAFIIDPAKKTFTGNLTLRYQFISETDKSTIAEYGFWCYSTRCEMPLSHLTGTLHAKIKSDDLTLVNSFQNPFRIKFAVKHSSGGGIPRPVTTALMPFAITLDLLTAPLFYIAYCTASNC